MLLTFDLFITYEKVVIIFTSFFIWNVVYLFIHMAHKPRDLSPVILDAKNRLISIIHGIASKYLSLYCIIFIPVDYEAKNIFFIDFVLLVSVGYFIYDSFSMFYFNLWDMSIVLHHFMSISGILITYFSEIGGYFVLVSLVMAEISNWPMHTRVILKEYGLRYTRIYEVLEISYFFLYFLGRIIFGPYLLYLCFKIKNIPWPIFFICIGILLQSFIFFKTMISIIKNKFIQRKERRKNQLHYWWFSVNPKILELDYTKKKDKQKVF